jgi:regulator of RNase E activity RraA
MDTPIKQYLSAALLSDIMDDMGYKHQMLPVAIKPNYVDAKIVGRARTLQLQAITNGEDYRRIYEGLPFIEQMNAGEILVVAGGSRNYAFFGELMSTLSQKRGLEGAIVDGLTRDTAQTRAMEFPVFARDNYARDIKKRGIIVGKDTPVTVGGVGIERDTLIVGDYDGVIVVPKSIEEEVLSKALCAAKLEERIKEAIKEGVPVTSIINQNGDF